MWQKNVPPEAGQIRRRAEGVAPLPRPVVALPSLPIADDAVTESGGPRDLMPSENER